MYPQQISIVNRRNARKRPRDTKANPRVQGGWKRRCQEIEESANMVEAEVKEEAPENGEGAGGDKAAGGDNSATEAAGGDHPSTQAAGGDNTATQTAGWEDEHMSYRGKGGGEGGELCYSVSRYENGYVHLIYETKY